MSSIGKIRNGKYEEFANNSGGMSKKDVQDATIAFEESAERENINSGETLTVLFGKIKKYFSSLKNIAFTGDYKDIHNAPDPTAVKGDKESSYRTGDVNLTCENIGAIPTEKIVASTNITEAGFLMEGKTASDALENLKEKTKTKMANGVYLEYSNRNCSLLLYGATYKSSGSMGFIIPSGRRPDESVAAYVLCNANGVYYPGLLTISAGGGFTFRSYPIGASTGTDPASALLFGSISWIA